MKFAVNRRSCPGKIHLVAQILICSLMNVYWLIIYITVFTLYLATEQYLKWRENLIPNYVVTKPLIGMERRDQRRVVRCSIDSYKFSRRRDSG